MRSKVINANFLRETTSKYGTMYVFAVEMSDGIKGNYLSKNRDQTTFTPGQEIDYKTEVKQWQGQEYTNIKPAGNFAPRGPAVNQEAANKRCALICAVNIYCANRIEKKEIETYANNFLKYLSAEK